MAIASLLIALVTLLVPMPSAPEMPPNAPAIVKLVSLVLFAVPMVVGVWWLVLFNTKAIKDVFARTQRPGEPSSRPLSVSVIGWINLVSGVSSIGTALFGVPVFIAGVILDGWSAQLVYVLFGAIGVYLGWALLELQERARVLTMVWYALGAAHATYMALLPHARARMRDFLTQLEGVGGQQAAATAALDSAALWTFMMFFMLALVAVACWFLVRNKPSFDAGTGTATPSRL